MLSILLWSQQFSDPGKENFRRVNDKTPKENNFRNQLNGNKNFSFLP